MYFKNIEFKEKVEDKVQEEVSKRVVELEDAADNRIMEIKSAQIAAEKRLHTALEEMQQVPAYLI